MECLNKHAKKKEQDRSCTSLVGTIATNAKLLDITHKSYEFNADLIEAIN